MHRQLGTWEVGFRALMAGQGGLLSNGHSFTSTVLAQVRVGYADGAGLWQALCHVSLGT